MKARHAKLVALAGTGMMLGVVGIALLWPSSSDPVTARPGSLPTAARIGLVSDSDGARRTVTEQGVRFSFRVPTTKPEGTAKCCVWVGWERFSSISTRKSPGGPISLNKSFEGPQGAEAIIYWTSFPDGDYADPCARLLGRSVGRSAAALAAAVATAPGTELVHGPVKVTLDGRPAKYVVLLVRKTVGCDPGFFYTWRTGFGGAFWRTTDPGHTIRAWIVADEGTRLFIASVATKPADLVMAGEIFDIVESIRFE